MSVEVRMNPTLGKSDITSRPRGSGGGIFPVATDIMLLSIPLAGDRYRSEEIHSTFIRLLEYCRENQDAIYGGAGALAIVTTLNDGKTGIRHVTIATNVVAGEFAVMIGGNQTGMVQQHYAGYRQMIDFLREHDAFGVNLGPLPA